MNALASNRDPVTLLEVFEDHARHRARDTAYVFLGRDGREAGTLSFGELQRKALAIAHGLRKRGNQPGERVLLLTPSGPDFINGFLGILHAGMVAVPAMAPRADDGASHLLRILDNAHVGAVITTDDTLERMRRLNPRLFAHLNDKRVLPCPREACCAPGQLRGDPHHPAFLQYTSGSTGAPKGVIITHANLMDNQRMIARAFGHDSHSTVVVGWLPLHHDMGLVGNVLQPLFLGRPCILLSPMDFLIRPLRWLQAIDKYRATTSGGPNFAYALCTQKISRVEAASLDLSSWTLAFNGAEPVRESTMSDFARRFSRAGFDKRSFYPCYGLAECTLFVAGAARKQGTQCAGKEEAPCIETAAATIPSLHQDGGRYVSMGVSWGDNIVRIVDPVSGQLCPPGTKGEIWVSGPSVSPGYWEQEVLTKESYNYRLAEEPSRHFFRTGDLGFQACDGQLYIVGRIKDMIIVRGVNYYPEDIEAALALHPMLKGQRIVAFSIDGDPVEQLVILAEASGKQLAEVGAREQLEAFSAIVLDNFGIRPTLIAWTPAGALPVTTSGKVRRKQCRSAFLAQSIHLLCVRASAEEGAGTSGTKPIAAADMRPAGVLPSAIARTRTD